MVLNLCLECSASERHPNRSYCAVASRVGLCYGHLAIVDQAIGNGPLKAQAWSVCLSVFHISLKLLLRFR